MGGFFDTQRYGFGGLPLALPSQPGTLPAANPCWPIQSMPDSSGFGHNSRLPAPVTPMPSPSALSRFDATLEQIRNDGLFKGERVITSPQSSEITLADGRTVLNFCANNYLGLADDARVIAAAKDALDTHGFGMASVRFICGTQDLHKQLEAKIAAFFGKEDAILYAACFDANGGLYEPLLGEEDAIVSDALNHASIIDGVRLCKAKRYRYANCDMADLEAQLVQARADGARDILVSTDGVFSMDGFIAPLDEITALAAKYDALVHIDECHATGFLGATGRGSAEVKGVLDRIDLVTGTLGKALGGALGGFTTGPRAAIELLRQRSRPYLFSNSLPPHVVAAGSAVFDLLAAAGDLRDTLARNTAYFREQLAAAGFDLKPGVHPIVPVMLYDAPLAQKFAAALLDEGIYAIGFFFPVVPKGQARIRTQVSAAHTREQLDRAIAAFTKVGRALGVL
jgi:glycine C-acetyltransferase